MKILIINNMGTVHAGAEIMIAQLRRGLREKGHIVKIFAGDRRGNGEYIADYIFKTFRPKSSLLRIFYLFNPFAFFTLWRILRSFCPDVVHIHNASEASPFILLLLRNYRTLLTVHDHMVFDPTRINDTPLLVSYRESLGDYFVSGYSLRYFLERLRFFFFRRFSKYIDLTLACSVFYFQCVKDSGMFGNVKVLHNGITLEKYVPIKNWERLLYIGRLDKVKGVHVLLAALPEIRDCFPNIVLNIVGTGDQEDQLKNTAQELEMGNHIQFLGHQSPEQVAKQYKESTLVVVPSLYPDNFPTVCIEAMAIGRPVIASRVGGIPELIIDNETGRLVAPNKFMELAKSIIDILENPKDINRMSREAVLRVRREFDGDIYVAKTEQEYFTLMNTSL